MTRPALMLLTALILPLTTAGARPAPTGTYTLPKVVTTGVSMELPVQPGTTVTVQVNRGLTSWTPDRANRDFAVTRAGNALHVTLASAARPRRGDQPDSVMCLNIKARGAAYRLCLSAEQPGVARTFVVP